MITFAHKTTFAQDNAEEQFSFLMQGQTPTLEGYRINSNALIVK